MNEIIEITKSLGGLPVEQMAILLGLAAIGLAAFAIHAVLTVMKQNGRRR